MISQLFTAIDAKNVTAFKAFLADDCVFRFGNQSAVYGVDQIEAYVTGFFASIQSLSHQPIDTWSADGVTISHGLVTYVRHDKSQLTVPFCVVLKLTDAQIGEYLIFADVSAL